MMFLFLLNPGVHSWSGISSLEVILEPVSKKKNYLFAALALCQEMFDCVTPSPCWSVI